MSAGSHLGSPRAAWRRIPVDVVALAAIAIGIVATHLPFLRTHGMCFNDPSWYFHFGNRTLHGDVPYRDYVFQVGPLPIYVDAAFQAVFGAKFVASLLAGLFVKVLRASVIWLIVRRLAGLRAAALLMVFCAFDPLFAFVHHWSTSYAELFLTLSGLFLLLASRSEGRRALVHLALAGCSAALVIAARQSAAIVMGAVLLGTSTVLLARREFFTPRRFVALWGGYAAAVLLLAAALAALGALGPAIQQMLLDAPSKKGIHGVDAGLDAISGGALLHPVRWHGFLLFLALPVVAVAGAIHLTSRGGARSSSGTLAILVVPGAVLLGMFARVGGLDYLTDLPRTFLTATTALALLSPDRMRRWLGVEPIVAIGFGALALASDWALEMSFPGRGWTDVWALIMGALVLVLASHRLAGSVKRAVCGAFAAAAVIHCAVTLGSDQNPFNKREGGDGPMSENSFSPHVRGAPHPMLRGLRVTEWRGRILEWLADQVPPGSTCFIYANLPALYTLLDCANPTRLDTTIADFPSARDAAEAAAALRRAPPDFILAYDDMWMSPGIGVDLEGKVERYASWNPRASMEIHVGLRAIIDRYEDLGRVADALPAHARLAAQHWDVLDAVRIYRRRR